MADFYLDKKYAITKSNEKLFIDFGELAKEYLRGSLLLLNDLTLGNMISSSISFSCELFLKSLLLFYNTGFRDNTDGHNLEELYNLLPKEICGLIKDRMTAYCPNDDFKLTLHEVGNTFMVSRYSCEQDEICTNVEFLFNLAKALMTVFDELREE